MLGDRYIGGKSINLFALNDGHFLYMLAALMRMHDDLLHIAMGHMLLPFCPHVVPILCLVSCDMIICCISQWGTCCSPFVFMLCLFCALCHVTWCFVAYHNEAHAAPHRLHVVPILCLVSCDMMFCCISQWGTCCSPSSSCCAYFVPCVMWHDVLLHITMRHMLLPIVFMLCLFRALCHVTWWFAAYHNGVHAAPLPSSCCALCHVTWWWIFSITAVYNASCQTCYLVNPVRQFATEEP